MEQELEVIEETSDIARASYAADKVASRNVFSEYHRSMAPETLRRQKDDLALFTSYLQEAGIKKIGDFFQEALAWRDISGGLVKGFREWMLQKGYAIGSINVRLSTIKRYTALAYDAKELMESQLLSIKEIKLLRYSEGLNIDKSRNPKRVGNKKSQPVLLTDDLAQQLKQRPDTPQGRRDSVLMCLLLNHGLRCSEVALLQVNHFDMEAHTFKFERPKVHKHQTHRLTPDTYKAVQIYLEKDSPRNHLLQASRKDDRLINGQMSSRAITARVQVLGKSIGVSGLSAHDCRHYWATKAARNKTDVKALQTAGGWNSPIMPLRYIQESEIANEGVKLE